MTESRSASPGGGNAQHNTRASPPSSAGRELLVVLNHNLEDFDADSRFHSDTADLTIKYRHTLRY